METISVSKGVFLFKNGFQVKKKKSKKLLHTRNQSGSSDELWYQSYKLLWNHLEQKIQSLNNEMFSNVLSDLILFVQNSYAKKVSELPAATLLTGINMPDHATQFSTFSKEITTHISPHVATLNSQDCNNLKSLVENMINQLINGDSLDESDLDLEDEDDSDEKRGRKSKKIKKSHCSFGMLQSWYEDFDYGYDKKVLCIIIPDFEGFNAGVLQDFIQIASNYLNILPFVLIFGVATSLSALNKALPYHVSSRVNIQVFNSQPSTKYLNSVLENVFFTDDCPFHLGGQLFALFLDIFLFYDFSVTGFIQNFKYAMLEHYSRGSHFALCTTQENINEVLDDFEHEDFENVRHLFSFRALVEKESPLNQIKLVEDDKYFRIVLESRLNDIFAYMNRLHTFLKCLQVLVEDLPKSSLEKQVREFYISALNKDITELATYQEAFQLLGFQSKDELVNKITQMVQLLRTESQNNVQNSILYQKLSSNLRNLLDELIDGTMEAEPEGMQMDDVSANVKLELELRGKSIPDRKAFKEQLFKGSKQQNVVQTMNKYEKARLNLVTCLKDIFSENLRQPKEFPFFELFFYNEISIQNNVIGSHRAAIHTALNDPSSYLECKCCKLPNDASILNSMPDICIAYKLHLEYGKLINLYDWLQAFLSILDPIGIDEDDDQREVDPRLQARFTQCVAELEYLGFVKSSKRKTDHVSRLTWGG